MKNHPKLCCQFSSAGRWYLPAIVFTVCFSLSCRLSEISANYDLAHPGDSAVSRILGSTRLLASAQFIETADRYFHKGMGHRRERALQDHPFRKLQTLISPEYVQHVYGYDMRELVPWLWFAVEVNPNNVDAYLVAAYILARQIGIPDAAHKIIQKGMWENPMEYRLAAEDARIYLREGRVTEAIKRFEAALAFADRPQLTPTADLMEEKAAILSYLGLLYETQNRSKEAIACYRRILDLFPDRSVWQKRIEDVQNGVSPSVLAEWLWRDTLNKHDEEQGACRHKHHHDVPDGGEEEHGQHH